MSRKQFSVAQIINYLREAEVRLAQGKTVGGDLLADWGLGAEVRDELLNTAIFYSLEEAPVLIER